MRKNILVFPCGSEIGLEIYRSLKHSIHFNLIGASSIADHGKFVFENYIEGLPFINDEKFLPELKKIVQKYDIDAVYPAMDTVVEVLKKNEDFLGCKIVSSKARTAEICLSKLQTYSVLQDSVRVPIIFDAISDVKQFPVFTKPNIGYGSRGAEKCNTEDELEMQIQKYPDSIIMEYLPGNEYTVDCFTDKNGMLLFAAPRQRCRVMNGISVNTKPMTENIEEFSVFAETINCKIEFNGAWFFQVKRDKHNQLTLLEIASRFAGSSAVFRAKGINFALMSLFNIFDFSVTVIENKYMVELDRALDNIYKLSIQYDEVFVDFDDCIYLERKYINYELIGFLYKCISNGKKITLLSKHDDAKYGHLSDLLNVLRIKQLFDRVIHLLQHEEKYKYIDNKNSIFIDDSFAERKAVADNCGINVFSLDMIEVL